MGKEKNSLSLTEAKQQFRDSMAKFQPKQIIAENIVPLSAVSFVAGMISADSAKSRESLINLGISLIQKSL